MNNSDNKTVIAYITGKPGMGKYTISKELSKYNYIICDNQLINNPIFELLKYDGLSTIPDFAWKAVHGVRSAVFKFLTNELDNNYVLTNNLYADSGDNTLYNRVLGVAQKRGSIFVPIKLMISENEHLKRVTNLARRERYKSIDPMDVYDKTPLLDIDHPNLLTLDVTQLTANCAAQKIHSHIPSSYKEFI